MKMTRSQQDAMRSILTTKDRFIAIQGYAGVAKTTMLSWTKLLIEEADFRVRGLTVASSAAIEMTEKSGIKTDVFPLVLKELKNAKNAGLKKTVFILDEAFSPRSCYRFWETALAHKADTVWITPTMAATLQAVGLEEEEQRGRIAAGIRRVVVAMGPIASDVKARFESTFGVRLQKSFGITETLLCCHWNDAMDTPVDSVGKPFPGVEVHIIGEDEQPVARGQEGEIRIGGAWKLDEYWHQPDITAASFDAQRRYKTGDLGRIDAQGHVFITGRIKDMLKCGGLNVSPAEVEAAIARLAGVREAAVFGVPDDFYGEKIIACVSLLPGSNLGEQDIIAHCRAGLTAMKVPSVVVLKATLPQNAVGKVDKRALRQAYLAALQQGAA
ncbi:MAG: hypothetical protein EBV03_03480 [Proteobacteria bacterium]|nr:hypothetical protein [Pseudomonadota bacterium]